MPRSRDNDNEAKKKRRVKAREQGLCTVCLHNKPTMGTRCDHCKEVQAHYLCMKRSKQKGK